MSEQPSPSRVLVCILILWFAGLGAAGQFAKIGVPFAEIQAMFPQAGASVGLLLSLVSLVGAAFGMVAGVLVTGIGLRRALIFALIFGGLVSLMQAQTDSLPVLLVSRGFEGLSHLLIVVAAPTLIAQLAPDRFRSFAMTLWATFFGVAYALTAWLGMDLVARAGLAGLFRAHGIYMLVCAAALVVILPRASRQAVLHLPTPRQFVATMARAYGSARIAAPGFGWLFYTLTFVSLLAILPALIPPERREAMIATLPLISIASGLAGVPLLLRFVPPVRLIQLGFGMAAISAALMALAGPILPAIGLYAALGIIQGASYAAVPVLNHSAEDRALANGLMAQMGNLGNLLGTPLLLVLLHHSGIGGLIAAITGCYLLGILCHVWMAGRREAGV
ncbi:MFS transporter [Paracoccus xiamenensis]|uniref:MFS transporter n=1 Tax=Paracoccus xiamenensis TaxID=2714901 RepID=UPI00140A8ACD|nr:MFS transporter [Paracoccus xiamenensis]NHF74112.1 MFS transporter [Paracoccus xiamenensis]